MPARLVLSLARGEKFQSCREVLPYPDTLLSKQMLAVSPGDRTFIFTGAGVSAESGIPTFCGVGGLWRNYRIEEVASPEAWHRGPRNLEKA